MLSAFCPTSADMVRVATLTSMYRVQYPIEKVPNVVPTAFVA